MCIRNRHRILLTAVTTALFLTNGVEGKMRLVPRGKKNKNKKLRRPQKKANHAQILLKPKKKKPSTLKLEATIGKNENGQQVLLLSEDSIAAVSNAMQSSSSNSEVKQEAKQNAQTEAQQEVLQLVEPEEEPMDQQVLFYDPEELKTAPGEIPLPKRVFDADGNDVDMAGKEAVLVPPNNNNDNPPPPSKDDAKPHPKEDEKETSIDSPSSSTNDATQDEMLATPQTQDQMIIISTVATMALLVGALSARRLRSRQFLSFCIENESLEDELAYDAAYTTQSTVGASSFYAGAGYDTFGGSKFGGDLRWRGDLEKFDV
jgi:hypothetical protein